MATAVFETIENYDTVTGKIKNLAPNPEQVARMLNYLEAKHQRFKGLSDLERANLFWKTSLKPEERIVTPQHADCEFAIVIPVYNEKPARIRKQIDSLRQQKEISHGKFEIIYVVNNAAPDQSAASLTAIQNNKLVIEEIKSITDLPVFVIDKSSAGREIEGCNVGKARNLVTAAASLRFYENGKNGILIHTDADSGFEDKFYFKKLAEIMKEHQDVVGWAGGLVWKFDPDGEDERNIDELTKKNRQLILLKKWSALYKFLTGDEKYITKAYLTAFWGGHMVSKSYESAVIGGFFDGNALEDELFGLELAHYAAARGRRVMTLKDRLFLTTALRESTRTGGSIGRKYNEISVGESMLVPDAFARESYLQFRERVMKILNKGNFDLHDFRKLVTDQQGRLMVNEMVLDDLAYMLKLKISQAKRSEDIEAIADILYNTLYPKKVLTEDYYNELVQKVAESSDGVNLLAYIGYMARDL